MNGIRPKQHARLGEFHLEEAVLDVLLEAKHESECLGTKTISERAGIFRESGAGDEGAEDAPKQFNDAIVTGILIKLHRENRVTRCPHPTRSNAKGWMLTDGEFTARRDDVR